MKLSLLQQITHSWRRTLVLGAIGCTFAIGVNTSSANGPARPQANPEGSNEERARSEQAVQQLNHIIVIYQENWSFDSLYGQFPGSNGYAYGFDNLPQRDKSTNYSSLVYMTPQPLNGGVADNKLPPG